MKILDRVRLFVLKNDLEPVVNDSSLGKSIYYAIIN